MDLFVGVGVRRKPCSAYEIKRHVGGARSKGRHAIPDPALPVGELEPYELDGEENE